MIYHAKRTDKDYYPIGKICWGNNDIDMWYIEKEHAIDNEIDKNTILFCGYEDDEYEKFLSENVQDDRYSAKYHTYLDLFKHFVEWMNSPWSYGCEYYTVHRVLTLNSNLDQNYEWVCEYDVTGYDEVTSTLYGYGHTIEECMNRVNKLFDYLQRKYNPENISF